MSSACSTGALIKWCCHPRHHHKDKSPAAREWVSRVQWRYLGPDGAEGRWLSVPVSPDKGEFHTGHSDCRSS